MITETESGLTTSQYSDVQNEFGDLSAQIAVQRYGPAWSQHPDQSATNRTGSCFDAIKIGEYLLRAFGDTTSQISAEYLPSEVSGITDASWTYIDCATVLSMEVNVPISLATDSTGVRMFYYTTHGQIWYSDAATHAGPFGAGVLVTDPSETVIGLAAVSLTKLYYVTETSQSNRRFYVAELDGSWSITSTDIYWPYKIHGIDAVTMSDTDVVTISANLPPLIGSRVVGTDIEMEVNVVQGIVTWLVVNDRWSDWQVWDVIDRVPVSRYDPARDDVRLTYHEGILFATYERAGGGGTLVETYAYSKVAVSRSKDGRSWEFPEFVTDIPVSPYLIFPRSDYLYAVGVNETLRSPRCAWGGQTPIELDVTARVTQMQTEAAEIRNSSIALISPATSGTNIFPTDLDDTLAMSDDRLQVRYDLGYIMNGTAARVTVSTEDVITRELARDFQRMGVTLGSRDFLGRVNRMRADGAFEWPSMQGGRDHFDDPTGTGYGGMRFMAPYLASWKAQGGLCNLLASKKRGLAVSTQVTDTLNGSAQTEFQLQTASQGEYAGVAFRVFDKDNYHFVAYYLDDDAIKLYKVRAGSDTLLATSGAMSWTVNTDYGLKVRTHYGLVYVYTSTDGITWTALGTGGFAADGSYELAGASGAVGDTIDVVSGKFGLVGYGYSEEDEWPDWEPDPWPVPVPHLPILDTPKIVYTWGTRPAHNDQLWRTENFNTESSNGPTWVDVTGTLDGEDFRKILTDSLNRYIYVLTDTGLYRGSVDTTTPTWTTLVDDADPPVGIEARGNNMAITIAGALGIPAIQTKATCPCTYTGSMWPKQARPAMIVVTPDGNVTVAKLSGTWCCPDHEDHDTWAWDHTSHFIKNNIGAAGNTLRYHSECDGTAFDPEPYDCHHTCYVAAEEDEYSPSGEWSVSGLGLTDEGSPTESSIDMFQSCDMATYGFGINKNTQETIHSIVYGTPGTTDVTPDGWPANWAAAEKSGDFDRDALMDLCVITHVTIDGNPSRVWIWRGILFQGSIIGGSDPTQPARPGLEDCEFTHCSCYILDEHQLFLAMGGTGNTKAVIWTRDQFEHYADCTGNLDVLWAFQEVRPVWAEDVTAV